MPKDLIAMLIVTVASYPITKWLFGGYVVHIGHDELGWSWWIERVR